MSERLTYAAAGVHRGTVMAALAAGTPAIRGTFSAHVLGDVGQFGGLFHLTGYRNPVLVSTIDGVGTKVLLAREAGRLDVVGRDAIVHGVNDVAVLGATPLFALDYLAASRLEAGEVTALLAGATAACREEGVALIGGETAQMPGVYAESGLDVVAAVVGVAERDGLTDGSRIRPGDILIGMASAGLHTNGYSLARAIMARRRWALPTIPEGLSVSLADALLVPHRSYRRPLTALAKAGWLRGAAHVTGGGISANLLRILPEGRRARLDPAGWPVPRLFSILQQAGNMDDQEMSATFNMGVGMIVVAPKERGRLATDICRANGAEAWVIGSVISGERGVEW
ncbi:MAG TPA: phosphoribosylformylglycinamidine cyclo-ligase [bacterium]